MQEDVLHYTARIEMVCRGRVETLSVSARVLEIATGLSRIPMIVRR